MVRQPGSNDGHSLRKGLLALNGGARHLQGRGSHYTMRWRRGREGERQRTWSTSRQQPADSQLLLSLLLALRRRLAKPRDGRGLVARSALTGSKEEAEAALREGVAQVSGPTVESRSRYFALLHALATQVGVAQAVHRVSIPLVRGQLEIARGLLEVLRDASSVSGAAAKVELCARTALISSPQEPAHGLFAIPRHVLAVIIGNAHIRLCLS